MAAAPTWAILGLAIPLLSACQSSLEGPDAAGPRAGTYLGDHGDLTRTRGLESELILEGDGGFRYFLIDSNSARQTAKGRWSASGDAMVWTETARSLLLHGGFRKWDTLRLPDTSFLRKVTETGFERLEATYDSLFTVVVRWVAYRRIEPAAILPEGAYEFTETYRDGVDTGRTVTGLTRIEIARNSPYVQKIFRDGVLHMTDVDSGWTQAGTHLITTRNRHCDHEPGRSLCVDAPRGYEYVARLADVGDAAFRLWMAPDFTFQEDPYWAEFRKVTR